MALPLKVVQSVLHSPNPTKGLCKRTRHAVKPFAGVLRSRKIRSSGVQRPEAEKGVWPLHRGNDTKPALITTRCRNHGGNHRGLALAIPRQSSETSDTQKAIFIKNTSPEAMLVQQTVQIVARFALTI